MISKLREAAFQAINDERAYQESKWDGQVDTNRDKHRPNDWLLYIEDYVIEAKRVSTRRAEPEATEFVLHALRKIAAMAVAAMEQNGIRTREVEGGRPVGFVEP